MEILQAISRIAKPGLDLFAIVVIQMVKINIKLKNVILKVKNLTAWSALDNNVSKPCSSHVT